MSYSCICSGIPVDVFIPRGCIQQIIVSTVCSLKSTVDITNLAINIIVSDFRRCNKPHSDETINVSSPKLICQRNYG